MYTHKIIEVERALVSIHNGRGEEHRSADKWLQEFQTTPEAWHVADALLMKEDAPLQVKFFGAMSIHNKIKYDFRELPPDSVPSLQQTLMVHITRLSQLQSTGSAQGSVIVLKRLCLAVSTLAIQMNWQNVVSDFIRMLGGGAGDANGTGGVNVATVGVVLELLKVLPEECCNSQVLVDEQQREDFLTQLKRSYPLFLNFLQQVAEGPSGRDVMVQEAMFECLQMWIRYTDIPPDQLAMHPLLPAAFDALRTPDLFEVAVDLLVEILRVYEDPQSCRAIVAIMVPRAMALRAGYIASVTAEDNDEARGYVRLFTEMGESYMPLILREEDLGQLALVELIVMCTTHPCSEIATIPLRFWYRLAYGLTRLEPPERIEPMIAKFQPVLDGLIEVLVELLRYPEDFEERAADQVDDMKRDRYDVSDVILDCCRVLGPDHCLRLLLASLERALQQLGALGKQGMTWQPIEACLFAIRAVVKFHQGGDCESLPRLMQILLQLPQNPHIRYTANLIVGNAAAWLKHHPENLQPMFEFLVNGFQSQECAAAAAISIRSLCKHCGDLMGEPVLVLHDQLQAAKKQGGEVGFLQLKDDLEILEGLCYVVSSLRPLEVATRGLHRLLQPIANDLQMINMKAQQGGDVRAAARELDKLTCVLRWANPPLKQGETHPTMEVLTSLWPLLESLHHQHEGNEHFAEKLCRCYKHALRSCKMQFEPLLQPLITQIVAHFAVAPLSPYLYCGSICVGEFGHDPRFHAMLFKMFEEFSQSTFQRLTTLEQFTMHPDMVEEYFYLVGRVFVHCPQPLFNSPLLLDIVRCGVVGLQLDHREAHKGVLHCFEELMNIALSEDARHTPYRPMIEHLLCSQGQGAAVVQGLVGCIVGELPAYALDVTGGSVAGVLWKMGRLGPSLLRQWMTAALQQVSENIYRSSQKEELLCTLFPDDGVTCDKNDFADAIRDCSYVARQNARRWNKV